VLPLAPRIEKDEFQTKPYGMMFHHFCDAKHPQGQGAISGEKFERMLHHVGLKNILSAGEFQERIRTNKFKDTDVCITFDDNLRCQYDVAYPVLKKYKINAFWFVHTSFFEGIDGKLEIYRYYRTVSFKTTEDFYDLFFSKLMESDLGNMVNEGLKDFSSDDYSSYPFYSYNDRKFRFIRDNILKEKYFQLMDGIIEKDNDFSIEKIRKDLWMDEKCIKQLSADGHIIGLHSHTHPTQIAKLSYHDQEKEYVKNFEMIEQILGKQPTSVGYPCNSYNDDTLKIMKNLNISVGFVATKVPGALNPLTLPRNDHANILREMEA
jgi:peptidoglycan/xylan/chitin deacetylase (PgdA/CDA1 family)